MNEQEQFLKELDSTETAGVLEQNLNPEVPEKEADEVPDELKNRRHKRLEAKLEAERTANIQLAAKLEAISEAKKFMDAEPAEYLKGVERIYGTDSPEALAATELLKKSLTDLKEVAKQEAIEAMREERRKEQEEIAKEETTLDAIIEDLEDSYNVDLTSDTASPVRKGFFQLLTKLSPKDKEGNVIDYADPHAVWEEYQSRIKRTAPENRAKDLSARSMVQSGSSDVKTTDDATLKFLNENGII